MKFAIVDGEKRSPNKGVRGNCQYCGGQMVAKCGRFRMWHWAHMPRRDCDSWSGPETEWHRAWKGHFPADWQEVVHTDEYSGDRHIADVKTPHGLVIEFQHSVMDLEELVSREEFYRNMIWVVDGDRGSLDPSYFNLGLSWEPMRFRPLVHLVQWWGQSRLVHRWADASVPVYFDFGPEGLWRLLWFRHEDSVGAFSPLRKEWFVEACIDGGSIPFSFIPEDKQEDYLSQPRMVEFPLSDHAT